MAEIKPFNYSASAIVSRDSGILYSLVINASAVGANVKVYDGQNDNGKLLLDIDFNGVDTRPFSFAEGLPFYQGLYILVNVNVKGFSVTIGNG